MKLFEKMCHFASSFLEGNTYVVSGLMCANLDLNPTEFRGTDSIRVQP